MQDLTSWRINDPKKGANVSAFFPSPTTPTTNPNPVVQERFTVPGGVDSKPDYDGAGKIFIDVHSKEFQAVQTEREERNQSKSIQAVKAPDY
ncbi:hypothetical protein NFI96_017822 [Prochilodus magdalenae]|nr:hypothetical protein NFI96_017822 [Prochilodus magdalenae]